MGECLLRLIEELVEYLRSNGYYAELRNGEIIVPHGGFPLYLKIEFRDKLVYMSIKHMDEFRDVLEDLKEAGEDVEELVENAVSYLSLASLKARQWVEEKGLIPVFKLRDGSVEIYEILEEVLEEEE